MLPTLTRTVVVLACAAVLAGCTSSPAPDEPPAEPPGPEVSATEIVTRFETYADLITTEVLPTGAEMKVDEPVHAPPESPCDDGSGPLPDWAVRTSTRYWVLTSQDNATVFANVKGWLGTNGFILSENSTATQWQGEARDGISARLELAQDETLPKLYLEFVGPCAWPAGREGAPSATVLPPLPTPAGPVQATDAEAACVTPDRYVYNLTSPPYTGPGPHLAAIVKLEGDAENWDGGHLPSEWTAYAGADVDRARIQVVVCVAGHAGRMIGRIECPFREGDGTFTLHDAKYSVTVREASTGKEVAAFSVPGTQSDQDSCPAAALYRYGDPLLRGIDVNTLHASLRPLIEEPR